MTLTDTARAVLTDEVRQQMRRLDTLLETEREDAAKLAKIREKIREERRILDELQETLSA